MDPREKLKKVGLAVYGNQWKSPLSRGMRVDLRSFRRILSGERYIPGNLSSILLEAMEQEMVKINTAIEIITSDKIHSKDISPELIEEIASQFRYLSRKHYESAVEAMQRTARNDTYLSDLAAQALRFAINDDHND